MFSLVILFYLDLNQNSSEMIDTSTLHLHFAYCRRNRIKCEICQKFYDKDEEEEHLDEHKGVKCQYCYVEFQKDVVEKHLEMCSKRPKLCKFCKLTYKYDEFNDHFYKCGSRTNLCHICQKNIILRGYIISYLLHCCQIMSIMQKTAQTSDLLRKCRKNSKNKNVSKNFSNNMRIKRKKGKEEKIWRHIQTIKKEKKIMECTKLKKGKNMKGRRKLNLRIISKNVSGYLFLLIH